MGELRITIGEESVAIEFPDKAGLDVIEGYHDSVLYQEEDVDDPPSLRKKALRVLNKFAEIAQTEARGNYEQKEKVRQGQTIREEARNKFKLKEES